jgi:uncharacterized membrane protein
MIRLALPALSCLVFLLAPGLVPAGAGEARVRHLVCTGNEPFWRLEMGPKTARWSRPGREDVEEDELQGGLSGLGFLDPQAWVWRGEVGGDPAQTLVAVMRAETCHDTMADLPPFDFRAVVSFPDGLAATGCCRAALALDAAGAPHADLGIKAEGDWARLLPDLLPVVRSCGRGGPTVERVVKAWPMNHGLAGVRLVGRDGQAYDCVAELASGRVESITPVPAGATAMPGEGDPIFLPAREHPPLLECGRLERVLDPDGALQGWLHYGACG